jgi:hypothetical protein
VGVPVGEEVPLPSAVEVVSWGGIKTELNPSPTPPTPEVSWLNKDDRGFSGSVLVGAGVVSAELEDEDEDEDEDEEDEELLLLLLLSLVAECVGVVVVSVLVSVAEGEGRNGKSKVGAASTDVKESPRSCLALRSLDLLRGTPCLTK